MRFSQSFMDEIRERVPISDVIGTRVAWDKRKTNAGKGDFWGCCPFHGEKSPSFHCENRKGRYYCFGCGASGDHFRFLTELEGVSFPEAVERIATMAGVAMPAPDPEAEKREQQRATLYDVMQAATQFFQDQLQMQSGANARAYLRGRGLTASTLSEFKLGYAPDSRNALKDFLASKSFEKKQIEDCGLVVHGDDIPVSYDRFRDRIMFPIEDPQGRVIAFGGRAMSADVPAKYLNSPEGPLFHKSDVLYNFRRARAAAGKQGTLIAVEGYMDVIAMAQAGIINAVAPLGTALTEQQMARMWRTTNEPILCFDGDSAGLRAAFRALDLAMPNFKAGQTVRFALLPDGKDPDDLIKENGVDALRDVLAKSRSAVDLLWLRETGGKTFDTPERRAQLEAALKDYTSTIQDPSVRRHYGQEMRDRIGAFFGMDQRPQSGRAPQKTGNFSRSGGAGGPQRASRMKMAISDRLTRSRLVSADKTSSDLSLREAVLLSALICHPDLIGDHFDDVVQMEMDHEKASQLRRAILAAYGNTQARDRDGLLGDPLMQRAAPIIANVDEKMRQHRCWAFTAEAAFEDTREAFRQALELHKRSRGLSRELKAAETAFADEPSEVNFNRLVSIQAQIRRDTRLDALIEGFGQLSGRAGKS